MEVVTDGMGAGAAEVHVSLHDGVDRQTQGRSTDAQEMNCGGMMGTAAGREATGGTRNSGKVSNKQGVFRLGWQHTVG
jgi:hypothetical protein